MAEDGLQALASEVAALRLEVSELLAAVGRIEALLERVALSLGVRPGEKG